MSKPHGQIVIVTFRNEKASNEKILTEIDRSIPAWFSLLLEAVIINKMRKASKHKDRVHGEVKPRR